MIRRLLIANRGEVAVRVVRACRELGIEAVVTYSEADVHSLAVRMADRAVCIGPAPARQSYLHVDNIIAAASLTDCDAIHPGVGFLSENAGFAGAVVKNGLTFVGPAAETIALLGDKVKAKKTAERYRVPVIPGSDGPVSDVKEAREAAARIGYPIIVKAAAGGGGKGMRIVHEPTDLAGILQVASAEAESAFSDGTVYLEKYLSDPRHVEIQVLADTKGNAVHLGERDCSVQRNHQKLVEEGPSPGIDPVLREKMGNDAVRLFRALGYVGAGTVEFLVQDGQFYFMEVNARVQVEHPVTEWVTGVDIVCEQIRVAAGEGLSFDQGSVHVQGHALECRVNATRPGRVTNYLPPGGPGVRVDSFLYTGCDITPYYDSLLAKVIVHAKTRSAAITRMDRSLAEMVVQGVTSNIDEQRAIITSRVFRSGDFGTGALARINAELGE